MIVFGMGLAGFAALALALVLYHPFVALDQRVSAAVVGMATPLLDAVLGLGTVLGSFAVMSLLTALVAAVLLVRGMRAEAALMAGTMALGTSLGWLFKHLFERARPALEYARIPLPSDYSFPSGHALAAFLFFSTVAFIVFVYARSVKVKFLVTTVCFLAALFVAVSRVYFGVHYVGDVIASWFLGAAWMSVSVGVYLAFVAGVEPQGGPMSRA